MSNQVLSMGEIPDAVVCASCGHPIWDQRTGDRCETCHGRERADACSLFLLNAFNSEATLRPFDGSSQP